MLGFPRKDPCVACGLLDETFCYWGTLDRCKSTWKHSQNQLHTVHLGVCDARNCLPFTIAMILVQNWAQTRRGRWCGCHFETDFKWFFDDFNNKLWIEWYYHSPCQLIVTYTKLGWYTWQRPTVKSIFAIQTHTDWMNVCVAFVWPQIRRILSHDWDILKVFINSQEFSIFKKKTVSKQSQSKY